MGNVIQFPRSAAKVVPFTATPLNLDAHYLVTDRALEDEWVRQRRRLVDRWCRHFISGEQGPVVAVEIRDGKVMAAMERCLVTTWHEARQIDPWPRDAA